MRSTTLPLFVALCCASASWAQSAREPQSLPELRPVTEMPTPEIVDVALDDGVPFDGELPLSTAVDGSVVVRKGVENPFFLGFVAGKYYPPEGERVDPKLTSEVRLQPTDRRPAPTSYAFVMFSRRITERRLDVLRALGCRVLGFHPGYCMKVALPPSQIDAVGALDFVRWIGAPRAQQKLHTHLAERIASGGDGAALELIVNVYESDLCADATRELVATGEQRDAGAEPTPGVDPRNFAYRTHSNGWQQAALEALGVEVGHYTEKDSVRAFHVRAPAPAIEALVALDFVQFVEEELQAAPTHDESMPLVYSDSVRQLVNGGTSQTVVCGEIDSGLSTGHADLYYHLNGWGWDFSGSSTGAWYDACGHGTHVAGTITGDGSAEPRYRGTAPGLGWGGTGRFQQAKIFSGCGTQTVDLAAVMGVMRAGSWDSGGSFTPRSHVINNSWGSVATNAIGSEYDARLLDDEVFWQQQMYVFAAGNESGAGTIRVQAGAKNAFTVGSVDGSASLGAVPGALSSFSSQGPMGDSRWKPNVCAPGNSIRSLLANTWDQYTDRSGTSMAAPHVTGIAAEMCDHLAWLRYRPSGLASVLMASAVTRGAAPITSQFAGGLNQYGAGRVDNWLANYGSFQTGWNNWTFDLGAGQGTSADFYIPAGTTRVAVCMNWNEQAASAGASKAALNDWDLYLDFEPFSAGYNTGEYNAGLSSFNNTEIRYIDNPPAGWFRWKLNPYNATSTGRFGVTVFTVSGATQPTVDLTLSTSSYYTQPYVSVTMTASVYNPGYLASATYLNASGSTLLTSSYKYLNDGAFCDMNSSRKVTLGDILSLNSRSAHFEPNWYYEGVNPFTVQALTDNGAGDTATIYVTVDGTAPGAVASLGSPTHGVGLWSCDSAISTSWQPATDNLSGVLGYSAQWDGAPSSDPDVYVDTYATAWSDSLPDGGPYYFHVRAVDYCGNAGASTHLGPFYVQSDPTAVYCAGKINSEFCLPYMDFSGRASVNGPDNFHLRAFNILNNKAGLLFWSTASANAPFQGGTRCVGSPIRRTAAVNSGGSPTGSDCSGTYDYHWTHAYAAANGVTAGTWVYCQYWYRDPQDTFTTGLTNAVQFMTCAQ